MSATARLRRPMIGVAAAAVAVLPAAVVQMASAATGSSQAAGVHVVVKGLNGPAEIQFGPGGSVYVAELAAGTVQRANISNGRHQVIFKGVGADGVVPLGAVTYILAGLNEGGPKGTPNDVLMRGDPKTGKHVKVADLLAYEKAHNPDGQKQTTGKNADSVSNAYYILQTAHNILVADAGANDIVAYNLASGKLHTYHVFPNIRNTQKCKNAKNNDPKHPGCDPVPTGMAIGPNGNLFVSLLGAEVPHAAKVVELELATGRVVHTWGNLSSATGVAVGDDGAVYVSNLEYGLNQQKPDLDHTGLIIKIKNGKRSYAHVATPSGLVWHNGHLYASSHTLDALFAGVKNAGEIVRVDPKAFHAKP